MEKVNFQRVLAFFSFLMLVGCSSSLNDTGLYVFSSSYDFSTSQNGWQGDFADFKVKDSTLCKFDFEYTTLPPSSGYNGKSLKIASDNFSDNMFMFVKRKISGLQPNAMYTMSFEIELAVGVTTKIQKGDSLYLKAGASENEPQKVVDGDFYRFNMNKGLVNSNGANLIILGAIATADAQSFALQSKSNSSTSSYASFTSKSNNQGDMWIVVGTDSPFKGTTTVHYTEINVVFSRIN